MKNITIAGNIGKDAVTRKTQNGDAVTSWSVAVEEIQGQEKRSIWFDCNFWGKRGENLAQYLIKGGKVAVAGELSTRDYEGKTYLTIRANQVLLLGGKKQDGGNDDGGNATPPHRENPDKRHDMDDGIPF